MSACCLVEAGRRWVGIGVGTGRRGRGREGKGGESTEVEGQATQERKHWSDAGGLGEEGRERCRRSFCCIL